MLSVDCLDSPERRGHLTENFRHSAFAFKVIKNEGALRLMPGVGS